MGWDDTYTLADAAVADFYPSGVCVVEGGAFQGQCDGAAVTASVVRFRLLGYVE